MKRRSHTIGYPDARNRRSVGLLLRSLPALLLVVVCSASLACSTMSSIDWWPFGSKGSSGEESREDEAVVELERLQRGTLHCAAGQCENVYEVRVDREGRLQAEVYAPWGEGMPEFNLALLDGDQRPLARPVNPDGRPRRVVMFVEPGLYYIRVKARGNQDGRINYDLLAKLLDSKPTKATKPRRQSATATAGSSTSESKEQPVEPPESLPGGESRNLVVNAEVLDVEQAEDAKLYVLLDRGAPDQVKRGMRGDLVDQGVIIGRFVVEEVYPDGSRARVEGELSGQVGIDTIAAIYR